MRMVFAIAVASATMISVPAFAEPTWSVDYNRVANPSLSYGSGPGYDGYTAEQPQPTWSVDYNRVANPAWRYGPRPAYRDYGDSEGSLPTWSVDYDRVANPAWGYGPERGAYGYAGEGYQPTWSVQYNRVTGSTGYGW